MVKTGVVGSRINQIGHPHLRYTAQALKIMGFDQLIDKLGGDGNKTVDGVVYNFEV